LGVWEESLKRLYMVSKLPLTKQESISSGFYFLPKNSRFSSGEKEHLCNVSKTS